MRLCLKYILIRIQPIQWVNELLFQHIQNLLFQVGDHLHALFIPKISEVNKEILHLCSTFNVDYHLYCAWLMINLHLNHLIFEISFILHLIIDNHLKLYCFLHYIRLLMLSFQFFFQLFFTASWFLIKIFYLY
jgi:hypothetical protein